MRFPRAAVASILFLLVSGPLASAGVLDDLARDFAPVPGYVVQPAEGGFLIDRAAADGIDVGDIFSVVRPGEKIVHPVTGKELGTLDHVKGFLQVTRTRPGYSFTRPLGATEEIRGGDFIRRFEHVPALFLDRTGRGRPFFDRLRAILPGLEWRFQEAGGGETPAPPEPAGLSFLLGPDTLEVRAPGASSRSYDLSGERAAAPPAASAKAVPEAPAPRRAGEPGKEAAGPAGAGEYAVRGRLPDGVRMAAFAKDGDRILLAVTEGSRIDVFEVGDALVPLASGGEPGGGTVLGLHWWQPSPGGPPLLAATLAVEENRAHNPAIGLTVAGRVYALQEQALVPLPGRLPYLLGSFDRDGDGSRETLLGQAFDRDIFFGDRIREVRRNGDRLEIEKPSFPVSLPFAVQGSLLADLTGDKRPETVFIRNHTLFVYKGKKLLYESSREMGGSISVMTYDVNPGAAARLFTTEAFEVPPAAVDLDGDGRPEVLAVGFEGSSVSVGTGPDVRKSWLAILENRDGRFVRRTLGPELETPLQGVYATPKGVFVVATQAPSLFKPKRESYLLFLPFPERSGR